MPATPPLTHLFAFDQTTDRTRPFFMAEFAANGEYNLVLTDKLIRESMMNPRFVKPLERIWTIPARILWTLTLLSA